MTNAPVSWFYDDFSSRRDHTAFIPILLVQRRQFCSSLSEDKRTPVGRGNDESSTWIDHAPATGLLHSGKPIPKRIRILIFRRDDNLSSTADVSSLVSLLAAPFPHVNRKK